LSHCVHSRAGSAIATYSFHLRGCENIKNQPQRRKGAEEAQRNPIVFKGFLCGTFAPLRWVLKNFFTASDTISIRYKFILIIIDTHQ
ncbi:hypothetical protein, partial [Propionivibrio sp.]|uniref:hypothetical protein n=1 Tax=Propionivibrio sp. TaxID=2212460 RepID=UPI003BEF9ECD